MFFESWSALLRLAIVGVSAYVALVLLLRVFGKRTLAKLNAFDLVVTVALGSTLAAVLLNRSVALAEGVLAFRRSVPPACRDRRMGRLWSWRPMAA